MKGMVFNQLQRFVESKFGLLMWDEAVTQCDLPSSGIYVSTVNYQDIELQRLVAYFADKLGIDAPDVVRSFGQYVFPTLMTMAPEKAKQAKDLRRFLLMVHNIIHAEVNKLYQDSNLPDFEYVEGEQVLAMLYTSPRKLCHFSEGLIMAAAEHFGEPIRLQQTKCMHSGADHCHIEVTFL